VIRECECAPVDDSDSLAIGSVTVRQDFVVYTNVLQTLDDRERGARDDGFDHSFWGHLSVDCGSGLRANRKCGEQGLWLQEPDAR
jgi:hypothetical protein